MTKERFSLTSFFIRLTVAVGLVLATYNPVKPYSYFYWALSPLLEEINDFSVLKGFVGVVVLIGWTIFMRATFRSLGVGGTVLAIGFFGMLLWLIVDQGWVAVGNRDTIVWLVLIGLSGVLAAGLSWSHIRRRFTGQIDVDETDDH